MPICTNNKYQTDLAPRQKQPLHIKILPNKYSSFGISNSADPIIRSQRQMGEGWVLIPYSCKQALPTFQTDKPLNPPFTPVPLTRKGCFCLTDSETHLPASVPCNIPLQSVSQPYPNPQPAPTGSHIFFRTHASQRAPRFPSEANYSPPPLHNVPKVQPNRL